MIKIPVVVVDEEVFQSDNLTAEQFFSKVAENCAKHPGEWPFEFGEENRGIIYRRVDHATTFGGAN